MANPTGQTIVTNALTYLGINEQGGTPSTSDSNAVLEILNSTWDGWGIDEGLIFAVTVISSTLGAGANYLLGPSGPAGFTSRPSRIENAFGIKSGIRRKLAIVPQDEYFSHGDLGATALIPEELYADYNIDSSGNMTVYVYPIASGATLELEISVPFSTWVLGTPYFIPPGYQDAIQWVLAYKCLPMFGMAVSPEVAQNVTQMASKAEARLREANTMNRKQPLPAMVDPAIQTSPQAAAAALQAR